MPDINWGTIQPLPGVGHELASITGLLSALGERRAKAAQEAAARDLQERQFAAQQANTRLDNQRADEQLAMQRDQYGAQQEQHKATAVAAQHKEAYAALPGVKAALAKGDKEGARLAAEAAGIGFDESAPVDPQMLQERGQAAADQTAPLSALASTGFVPDVGQAAAQAAAQPTAREAAPRYSLSMPGRPVLDFSPYEEEQAAKAQREKQAGNLGDALGPAMQSPFAKQAIGEVQGMVKSGQFKPEEAGKATLERIQHLEDQANSTQRAREAGSRVSARAGQGADRLDLSKGTYAWTRAGQVLSTLGAKELILQDRKYGDMLSNLTASPNAALDAATSGQWVKLAQGGTGVISDSDMNTFWHRIGGAGAYVEGKVQGLIDGRIADGKRNVVAEAVQWLAKRARTNLASVHGSLRTAMENDPNITPEMKAAVLKTYGAEAKPRKAPEDWIKQFSDKGPAK